MKDAIVKWMLTLMEARKELSGLPICPYARQAYLANTYDIRPTNYDSIEKDISSCDLSKYQVVVCYYEDYAKHTTDQLVDKTKQLNRMYNTSDIVVLDNDPRDPLVLNGIQTTFDGCYLWIIQPMEDLNNKAEQLRKTKYYDHWTQEQLDEVVTWRIKSK